jgi:hypothetical protein
MREIAPADARQASRASAVVFDLVEDTVSILLSGRREGLGLKRESTAGSLAGKGGQVGCRARPGGVQVESESPPF